MERRACLALCSLHTDFLVQELLYEALGIVDGDPLVLKERDAWMSLLEMVPKRIAPIPRPGTVGLGASNAVR